MTIKAVIFDIGNVLIEWHPERFYDSVIGPDRRRALFEAVDLSGMNRRVDLGAPFRETVYETAAAHPEFSAEVRMWFDGWIKMASPEIPHSAKLLRALRKKDVPVFALSNFGVGSFEYAATVYPVFSEFDRRYISGYLEMMKPDPSIYQFVEDDCGLAPSGLLFTDDRRDNIEAAQTRGWQTHLFEGPEGLAKRLVDEGLLNAQEAAA